MKKQFFLLTALLLSFAVFAQKELGANEHYATLIMPDGTETEVVLLENLDYPWGLQKKITTVDKTLFESGAKIKGKDKVVYKSKDLKGFQIGSQAYESQKYSDLTAVGIGSLGGVYFLELVVDGKIKLYKYYEEPPVVVTGQTIEDVYADARNHPQILIFKEGDDKIKAVRNVKIENYISDNPDVLEKYNNGEYGNPKRDPERSGLGKLMERSAESEASEKFIFDLVRDYNRQAE